ncbi:MAG: bifunctional folylpolyglutamate synthase/dihydrofolate synthase [candidate division KSB1 bacterium]|nr:bifunctional folylpolyglutamate synthase/dihydrofolate synthase [candidate division KSB1 bacterium]MDZ7353376.1 bifunctional folylpolyglutamate synthase/dihydrofolate synthase [candidate division KSB1 bacterium]
MAISSRTQAYLNKLGFFGWQLGLQRIRRLARFLGNPQRAFPCVHLAGTNGKGSTAAMLTAIAQAAGLRVGLYTSPHLVHLNERIQINGVPISGHDFEELLRSCRSRIDAWQATYFEVLTALAFKYFAEQQVDLAIIETGLGGRLDATNIILPEISIITSIALEHQNYLGRTLAAIAAEKAGIIKPKRPCLSGVLPPTAAAVVAARCRELRAPLLEVRRRAKVSKMRLAVTGTRFDLRLPADEIAYSALQLNLLGAHQVRNAALAVCAASLLRRAGFPLSDEAIRAGLSHTHWPARLQLLPGQPNTLLDAAHNPHGMRVLTQTIQTLFPGRPVKVVMALMQDKSAARVLRLWQPLQPACFFATVASDRARPGRELLQHARALGLRARAFDHSEQALQAARALCRDNDLLCVTGSHYLLGELMRAGSLPDPYTGKVRRKSQPRRVPSS